MLSGEFHRKLRRLNPELRIWCGDNDHRPACLYRVTVEGFTEICGVDKQWVPEHTEFFPDGQIKKAGWRRTLRILIQNRLVNRFSAERVFNTHLPYAVKKVRAPKYEPKHKLIDKYVMQ